MRPRGGRGALAAPASEPRLRVAAVIIIDGRLVLVRQGPDDAPYYLLPGGGVTYGETLEEALVREVAEETALTIKPLRPVFLSDSIAPDGSRHVVSITFTAALMEGVPTVTGDTAIRGIRLVTAAELSDIDLRPPVVSALQDAWEHGFAVDTRYLGPIWTECSSASF